MKKLRSLCVLVLSIFALFLFTGCPPIDGDGSGSFTYDGATYSLTNGILEAYKMNDFDIVLASSGLDAAEWEGVGDVIWFDLISPFIIGAPGTYDWAGTDGFQLWDSGLSLDYNATEDTGDWIYGDWEKLASEDFVTLSRNGRSYTIEFSVTLEDGKVVTGSFTGPLPVVWENF